MKRAEGKDFKTTKIVFIHVYYREMGAYAKNGLKRHNVSLFYFEKKAPNFFQY